MGERLKIIYVPGLGDHRLYRQRIAIDRWSKFEVDAEVVPMNWAKKESWSKKLERLLKRIDELSAQKHLVALIGVSAGASAVINAYALRKDKIVGVVCIAGKINRPNAIGQSYHERVPALTASVIACVDSLQKLNTKDRSRILSKYGFFDPLVKKKDSYISGARNQISPTIGHVPTIAYQIYVSAASNIRFLKQQVNN